MSSPTPQDNEPSPTNIEIEQFSSNDINTSVESIADNIKKFNETVLKVNAFCALLKAEKADWGEEKLRIANTQQLDSIINLNVGGMRFSTTLATLNTFPDSMLGAMFSGRHTITKTDGEYFFDRSGRLFCYILDFLRDPTYKIDITGTDLEQLKKEAAFFSIDDVMFPPPPPVPVPVAPFNFNDHEGDTWNITPNADGVYYGSCSYLSYTGKRIMSICTGCNKGFCNCGGSIDYYKFPNFAAGRDIVPGQPQRSVCNDNC